MPPYWFKIAFRVFALVASLFFGLKACDVFEVDYKGKHWAWRVHVSTGIKGSRNHQFEGEPGFESLIGGDAVENSISVSTTGARAQVRRP